MYYIGTWNHWDVGGFSKLGACFGSCLKLSILVSRVLLSWHPFLEIHFSVLENRALLFGRRKPLVQTELDMLCLISSRQ